DEMQFSVEFRHSSRLSSCLGSHLRDQKPTLRQWKEIIGDSGFHSLRRQQELGMLRAGNIEKEDGILAAEQTQQSPTAEHLFVGRKMAVMRLVADISRRRNLNGIDHFSISSRVWIEVHNGEEVWRDVRLVARPHVKHGFSFDVSMLGRRVR